MHEIEVLVRNETKVLYFTVILFNIHCIFSLIEMSFSHHQAGCPTAHYGQCPGVSGLSVTESHRAPRPD